MKSLYIIYTRSCVFLLMMTIASGLCAQNTVTGTVNDESGTALPGVSILVKGTTNGTTTDNDGRFSLGVSPDAVLVVSFIGYASQEIVVGNRTNINIALQPDIESLQEVVITDAATFPETAPSV